MRKALQAEMAALSLMQRFSQENISEKVNILGHCVVPYCKCQGTEKTALQAKIKFFEFSSMSGRQNVAACQIQSR